MKVEIFTVCDFAQDYTGKLAIVGTFDTILAKDFPAFHPSFTIACKIRFAKNEVGKHNFKVTISDNKNKEIIPPMAGEVNVVESNSITSTVNLLFNLNQMKFPEANEYSIKLFLGNEEIFSTPLYINRIN